MLRKWVVILACVLMVAGCQPEAPAAQAAEEASYKDALKGAIFDPPRAIRNFSIASTEGGDFKLSEHQSEVMLLYFGYRTCPDFCPTTFMELRQVYTELGEPADKLKIIFVTIDPERDTLDYLGKYVAAFHEDFIGLRAEGDALKNIISDFGVVAEKRVIGESALSYLFDHTASIFLIGANGKLEAQYLYGTDYRDIVHDLRLILDNL